MKTKIIGFSLLLSGLFCVAGLFAQSEIKLRDINCYNLGDGRYYCHDTETKKPLQGSSRIIDGYTSQYIEVTFKDGIPNGSWKVYKYNKLTEECNYDKGILSGSHTLFYPDGEIKESRNYVNGKPDGKFLKYAPNGKVESEVNFKNGLQDGMEIFYDSEGKVRSETKFSEGKEIGKKVQKISSNGGDYELTAYYKDGKYDGAYSEIFTNGNIKLKGQYKDGKKEGVWESGKKDGQKVRTEEYSDNDKIKETIYYNDGTVDIVRELKNGKKNGWERKYASDGGALKSEIYYKDGEVSSASGSNAADKSGAIKQTKQVTSNIGNYTQSFYQISGKYEGEYSEQWVDGGSMKAKGQYKNGLKDGHWVYETQSGKKEKEENFAAGKLNGIVIKYSNGVITESQEYKNDIRNGECKKYNNDGKLIRKENYENDVRQGALEEYYPNGKIKRKGQFAKGRNDGLWQEFYANGKMSSESRYDDGERKGPFKTWKETGELESEGEAKGFDHVYKNTYQNGKLYMREYRDENDSRKVDYYDENGNKKK